MPYTSHIKKNHWNINGNFHHCFLVLCYRQQAATTSWWWRRYRRRRHGVGGWPGSDPDGFLRQLWNNILGKKKDGEIFEGTMTILNNPHKKPPSSLKSSQKNQTARHRVFGISQASQAEVPWHFSRALTRATATSRYQVCKAACPEIDGCSILQSVAVPILTHDKYVSCVYLCIYIYIYAYRNPSLEPTYFLLFGTFPLWVGYARHT